MEKAKIFNLCEHCIKKIETCETIESEIIRAVEIHGYGIPAEYFLNVSMCSNFEQKEKENEKTS